MNRDRLAGLRDESGFTLVELLIVIVVLGVLATIVVVAVRGVSNRGESAACSSDSQAIRAAEEASYAQDKNYVSESALVTGGFLRQQSSLHDITLGGSKGYTIIVQSSQCSSEAPVGSPVPE